MTLIGALLSLFWGYALGSISCAILVCKLSGLPDPRQEGSCNPGTTNVLRLGGKKLAALTLFGDMCKGLLAAGLLRLFFPETSFYLAAGLGAFFGHLYPLYFQLKGGKGVATSLGILLVWNPLLALLLFVIWSAIFFFTRLSSLAAILAAILALPLAWFLGCSHLMLTCMLLIVIFLLWRHRLNIQRLLRGEELSFHRKN